MPKTTAGTDIDETLCTVPGSTESASRFYKGRKVYLRPHLHDFMDFAFSTCQWDLFFRQPNMLNIFKKVVGDLNKFHLLEPEPTAEKFIRTRVGDMEIYLKDLTLLPDYQPDTSFTVDDQPSTVHPLTPL